MRKSLAILAAVVMLLGVANVTFATQARVNSLGKAWMYDGDFEDIYFYPNAMASYPRMIVAELGTYPAGFAYNGSAAITFANEEQTWGVAGLDINHKITNEDEFNTLLFTAFGMNPVSNKWHLFYARNVGGLSVGMHVARAAYAETYTYSDTAADPFTPHEDNSSSAGIWDFNFGLGYSPAENMEANLGFSFKTYSFSDEMNLTWPNVTPAITPYTETLESDGGSGIDVALQVMYGMSDNFKLVPTAGLSMSSIGYKTSYSDTSMHPYGGEMSTFGFWAGFGANYTPVENVRVIGGLDFGIATTTIEDTTGTFMAGTLKERDSTTFVFPGFSAAVEADVLKWLTLRIGASKDIAKTTIKATGRDPVAGFPETENTSTSADYQFGFGLGFKFNKLCIDVKLNDDAPYTAGYMFSGIPGEPFTQVSATYKF